MQPSFVFWQNFPNHLQSAWVSTLARKCGGPVWMVVESDISEARRNLGWSLPEFGPARLEIGITPEKTDQVIREAGPEAVHIFSGLGAYPGVYAALLRCIETGGLHMGLLSECPSRRGVSGACKFVLGGINRLRFGRHLDFLLGLGDHAGIRFRRLGYEPARVFDFAYYPPSPPADEVPANSIWPTGKVRLLHVGELSFRKGIDRVIKALGETGEEDWCYGLVGSGDQEGHFRNLAGKAGIESKTVFIGSMPNAEAMAVVASADVLVLASRFDGYGAVVNEAILRGVPVICSSDCGARQVIQTNPILGSVFTSQASLCEMLRVYINRGPRTPARTSAIKEVSGCVSPESGADYFLEIMAHLYSGAPRPTPPWNRHAQVTTRH